MQHWGSAHQLENIEHTVTGSSSMQHWGSAHQLENIEHVVTGSSSMQHWGSAHQLEHIEHVVTGSSSMLHWGSVAKAAKVGLQEPTGVAQGELAWLQEPTGVAKAAKCTNAPEDCEECPPGNATAKVSPPSPSKLPTHTGIHSPKETPSSLPCIPYPQLRKGTPPPPILSRKQPAKSDPRTLGPPHADKRNPQMSTTTTEESPPSRQPGNPREERHKRKTKAKRAAEYSRPSMGLAPLSIGRSRTVACALGALWGFGHSTGQLILGVAFALLKDRFEDFTPMITKWSGIIVPVTLMLIGLMGIYETKFAPQEDEDQAAIKIEGEVLAMEGGGSVGLSKGRRIGLATYFTGIVHGLSPDALVVVIPALALPTQLASISYISMFVIGTVVSMGGYTLILSSTTNALGKDKPWLQAHLSTLASVIAIAVGVLMLLAEFGLNVPLFS
eukprot:gene22735-29900_t